MWWKVYSRPLVVGRLRPDAMWWKVCSRQEGLALCGGRYVVGRKAWRYVALCGGRYAVTNCWLWPRDKQKLVNCREYLISL